MPCASLSHLSLSNDHKGRLKQHHFISLQVLEEGRLKEFDEPFILLENEASLFHEMVQQVGEPEFSNLLEIARDSYFKQDASYDDEVQVTISGGSGGRADSGSIW